MKKTVKLPKKQSKQSHPRLREALKLLSGPAPANRFPKAFKLAIWELMRTQTELLKLSSLLKKGK